MENTRCIEMARTAASLSQCTKYGYGVVIRRAGEKAPFGCGATPCQKQNRKCGSCTAADALHSALTITLQSCDRSHLINGEVFVVNVDVNGTMLPVELDSTCWDVIEACRIKNIYVQDPVSKEPVPISMG